MDDNKVSEDGTHDGESHTIQGFIQLGVVVVFIFLSFTVSGMLNANKKSLGQRAVESRDLFASTQTFKPGPYQINFKTTGVVQARSEISVVPQISGRVIAVNETFFEGGDFEAGEILFEIEPLDFELELRRLQAQVAQARTAFNIEEAESDAASAEWVQIYSDKPVPDLVARKPQKAEAWANLKAAKAQLENAQLDLERTKFSLPFTGRVLSTSLEQGQFVTSGQSYGSVYDSDTLEVQSSLEGKQLSWLVGSDDPNVQIEVMHLGETKIYESELRRGISALNIQTRFASVRFGFKQSPEDLVPGVFVDLNIQGPKLENVLSISTDALQKNGDIWAVDQDNKLYILEAAIVFKDDTSVVLSGIDQEVRVVVNKIPGAIAGMAIQTIEAQSEDE